MASTRTVGLTALTRKPRGNSIAAALTKASMAPLTSAAEAPLRIVTVRGSGYLLEALGDDAGSAGGDDD